MWRADGARGRFAIALVVLIAVVGLTWPRPAPQALRCGIDVEPNDDTIVMLSASWCGYCRRARAYLQARDIAHCEYDVEQTAEGRRRFAELPQRVVPVFEIRGERLFGFNRTEIEQTLIAHGLAEFPD